MTRRLEIALVASLVGLGCVPPTMLPAPVPAPSSAQRQVGVVVSSGPAVHERCRFVRQPTGSWRDVCSMEVGGVYPVEGQLFVAQELSPRFDLGGGLQVGGSPSMGAYLRAWPLATQRFRLGAQLDLGFAWGAIGLPLAVAATPDLWVFIAPGCHTSSYATLWGESILETVGVRLPAGLSVEAGKLGRVGIQAQALYERPPEESVFPEYRGWRFLGGVEVAHQLPDRAGRALGAR